MKKEEYSTTGKLDHKDVAILKLLEHRMTSAVEVTEGREINISSQRKIHPISHDSLHLKFIPSLVSAFKPVFTLQFRCGSKLYMRKSEFQIRE